MLLIRSQLLFKNLYTRFPLFLFATQADHAVESNIQQVQGKESLAKQEGNSLTYFALYKRHQSLFISEGLFNQSQLIKSSLNPTERSVLQRLKSWLEGKLVLHNISNNETQRFVNMTLMLYGRKDKHKEILSVLVDFDKKLEEAIETYEVKEQKIKQAVQILRYAKCRHIKPIITHLQNKLKNIIDKSQHKGVETLEILYKHLSDNEAIKNKIVDLICRHPEEQILKMDIQVEDIHISYFKDHIRTFCLHIDKQIASKGAALSASRFAKIISMLSRFPDSKEATNTLINTLHAFLQKKGYKSIKITENVIGECMKTRHTSLILFYILDIHGVQMEKIFDPQRYMPFKKQPLLYKAILSILVNRNKTWIDQKYLNLINTQIQTSLSSLSAFIAFYDSFRLINLPQFIQQFINRYKHLFKALQNPFQCPSKSSIVEKTYFVQFFFEAFPYKDKQIFLKIYEKQINSKLVEEMITLHLQQNRTQFVLDKYYNYMLLCHFKEAINRSNKKLLELGLQFLQVYRKAGIERTQNQYTQLKIWKLISYYIKHIPKLKELGIDQPLYQMILGYIKVDYKSYKHDYHYKNMIWELVMKLKSINIEHEIYHLIIKEALTYDSINLSNIDIIRQIKIDETKLSQGELLKFKCIKGEKVAFTNIGEDEIEALLANPSHHQHQDIIDQNIENIMTVLAKCKPKRIFSLLSTYSKGRSQNNDRILNFLLESTINIINGNNIDKIDFITIFKKSIFMGNFNMPNYYTLWTHIAELLCYKIHRLTLYSHMELIRFLHTQPAQRTNADLVKKYLQNIRKFSDQNAVIYTTTSTVIYYMLILSNLHVNQGQLNLLLTKMKLNTFVKLSYHQLDLALIFQQKLDAAYMKNFLHKYEAYCRQLHQRHNIALPNYQFIFDIQYRYLCAKYPELMKNMGLEQGKLQMYNFSRAHPQIYVSILNSIVSLLKCNWKHINTYNRNKIVKIKNTMIIFLSPYKNACIKQQQLIVRMLKVLEKDDQLSFVIVKYFDPATYEVDMINSIYKNSPLLTEQQRDILLKNTKHHQIVSPESSKAQEQPQEVDFQVDDEGQDIPIEEEGQGEEQQANDA